MLPMSAPSESLHAAVDCRGGPNRVWGYESSRFPVQITNLGLPELGHPETHRQVIGSADLYQGGVLHRRLSTGPVPIPIAVGETATVGVDLDMKAFEGDYDLHFDLTRADGEPLNTKIVTAPVQVKNTIFEAFVELINSCNFRCSFCPQTTLQRPQKPMDFELAQKVVRDLADMGHHHPIRVHLLGEPLLYPRFFDFVDYAHEMGQRILLATNGSRFEPETVAGIMRTGLDEMVVSLNTPDETLYNEQRGTTVPYEEYLAGIERMIQAVASGGAPPTTRINVLYDYTRADDPEELARVRSIANDWIRVVREATGEDLPDAEEAVSLEKGKTTLMALGEGIELQWTSYHGWGEGKPPKEHFCSYPWRQLAVLVDGNTTACCVDAEGEIVLGNVTEKSVEEIWNGPELNRLRAGFERSRAVTPRCARCTMRHDRAEFFPDSASLEVA